MLDGNTRRTNKTPAHTGSNVIEFSASATTLYGYNNRNHRVWLSTHGRRCEQRNRVGCLRLLRSRRPARDRGFGVDIKFAGGFIFATSGQMIDPIARTQVRTFSLPAPFGNIAVDIVLRRVFYLRRDGSEPTIHTAQYGQRSAFRQHEHSRCEWHARQLDSLGYEGLAFRTDAGQIFIVESSNWIP